MKNIDIPKVEQNQYDHIRFATEVAYQRLVEKAKEHNLIAQDNPAYNGLVYLPTEEVTEKFKEACKAVLVDLGMKVEDAK